jgi:hypothetical protein
MVSPSFATVFAGNARTAVIGDGPLAAQMPDDREQALPELAQRQQPGDDAEQPGHPPPPAPPSVSGTARAPRQAWPSDRGAAGSGRRSGHRGGSPGSNSPVGRPGRQGIGSARGW